MRRPPHPKELGREQLHPAVEAEGLQPQPAAAAELPLQRPQAAVGTGGHRQAPQRKGTRQPAVARRPAIEAQQAAGPFDGGPHRLPAPVEQGREASVRRRRHRRQIQGTVLEAAAPGFPQQQGTRSWLLQAQLQVGPQFRQGPGDGASPIQLALQGGAQQRVEPGQRVVPDIDAGQQRTGHQTLARLEGQGQSGRGLQAVGPKALQPQQAIAPDQRGLPGPQEPLGPLARLQPQARRPQAAIRPQATGEGLPQPLGELGGCGNVVGQQAPAGVQGQGAADAAAGPERGGPQPAIQPGDAQQASPPASLEVGLQGFPPERVARRRLDDELEIQAAIRLGPGRQAAAPGPVAPGAGGQDQGPIPAAQGQPFRRQRHGTAMQLPAQTPQLQAAVAAGQAIADLQPQAPVGHPGEPPPGAVTGGNQRPQRRQGKTAGRQPALPLLLLPLAPTIQQQRAATFSRRWRHPQGQIDLPEVEAQPHLARDGQVEGPGRRSGAPDPQGSRLEQAKAQVDQGPLAPGGNRSQHPELAPGIAAQVGPGPPEAQIQHGPAQPQAGQRVEPQPHRLHRNGGAVLGAGQKTSGADPDPIGAQAAVGAQDERTAHGRADLTLQGGADTGVDPAYDPVEPEDPETQTRPHHTNGKQPPPRTPAGHKGLSVRLPTHPPGSVAVHGGRNIRGLSRLPQPHGR